jgi:hypothetical protein
MGRARCPSHKSYFLLWDGHLARPIYFCKRSINKSKESVTLEQELVPDMIELITVFSAGLYGRAQSEKSETD